MKANLSTSSFHEMLIMELFPKSLSDANAICLMMILHSSHLFLSGEAKVTGNARGFVGITSGHAAEVVAALFESGEKSDYTYWYHRFWGSNPSAYEMLENPSQEVRARVERLRGIIESHPWVDRLENEDWELLS